jgi:hypothetical protein
VNILLLETTVEDAEEGVKDLVDELSSDDLNDSSEEALDVRLAVSETSDETDRARLELSFIDCEPNVEMDDDVTDTTGDDVADSERERLKLEPLKLANIVKVGEIVRDVGSDCRLNNVGVEDNNDDGAEEIEFRSMEEELERTDAIGLEEPLKLDKDLVEELF